MRAKSGEGFLYLGRSYRLSLVADQEEPLLLKNGRFRLRRDLVDEGEITAAKEAFRQYCVQRGRGLFTLGFFRTPIALVFLR